MRKENLKRELKIDFEIVSNFVNICTFLEFLRINVENIIFEREREREKLCVINYLKKISKNILYIIEKLRIDTCVIKKTLTLTRGKITDLKVIKE